MKAYPAARISLREENGCRRDVGAHSLSYYATVPIGVVDTDLFDDLEDLGAANQTNVRLCLHPDPESPLQEMIILQAAHKFFPPKRHMHKAKSFTVMRGALGVFWFDATGGLAGAVALSESGPRTCRIDAGVYHVDVPLTRTCIHQEVTIGPFRGSADRDIAPWGPLPEDEQAMARYRADLIARAGLRDLC